MDRWYGTPLNKRLCLLCKEEVIGDEFHYILECSAILVEEIREKITQSIVRDGIL